MRAARAAGGAWLQMDPPAAAVGGPLGPPSPPALKHSHLLKVLGMQPLQRLVMPHD